MYACGTQKIYYLYITSRKPNIIHNPQPRRRRLNTENKVGNLSEHGGIGATLKYAYDAGIPITYIHTYIHTFIRTYIRRR